MNDINRLVIFLLLITLIYALYKYQNLILEKLPENFKVSKSKKVKDSKESKDPKKIQYKKKKDDNKYKYKRVTLDNISQISLNSLNAENISDINNNRQDSMLGSLISGNDVVNSDLNSLFEMSSNESNESKSWSS